MNEERKKILFDVMSMMVKINTQTNKGREQIDSVCKQNMFACFIAEGLFEVFVKNVMTLDESEDGLNAVELLALYTEFWKGVDFKKLCPVILPKRSAADPAQS